MSITKPFSIPKRLVLQAFQLIKANKGSAGIDQESLKDFESNLKDNLYLSNSIPQLDKIIILYKITVMSPLIYKNYSLTVVWISSLLQ